MTLERKETVRCCNTLPPLFVLPTPWQFLPWGTGTVILTFLLCIGPVVFQVLVGVLRLSTPLVQMHSRMHMCDADHTISWYITMNVDHVERVRPVRLSISNVLSFQVVWKKVVTVSQAQGFA